MHCPECGAPNNSSNKFCQSCGQALQVLAPSRAPSQIQASLEGRVPASALFMRPVLTYVSEGGFLRRFVSLYLQVSTVLVAALGIVLLITSAVQGFESISHVGDAIAVLLLLAVAAVAVYMHSHLLWLRAETVRGLKESHYTALPISAVMIRLAGEQLAVLSVVGGVTGLIASLFAGTYLPSVYPMGDLGGLSSLTYGLLGGGALLAGLASIVSGAVVAFVVLLISYFLAEALVVLVDIADNTRTAGRDETIPETAVA